MLAGAAGILTLTVTSFAVEWLVNPLLLHLFPARRCRMGVRRPKVTGCGL